MVKTVIKTIILVIVFGVLIYSLGDRMGYFVSSIIAVLLFYFTKIWRIFK